MPFHRFSAFAPVAGPDQQYCPECNGRGFNYENSFSERRIECGWCCGEGLLPADEDDDHATLDGERISAAEAAVHREIRRAA